MAQALKAGENMMGAEVGNGWYIKMDDGYTFSFPDFMPPNPNLYRPFGRSLILAVKLELEFEDGSREVLWSDESFRVHAHPVTMTNVYGSETEDRRLRVKMCIRDSILLGTKILAVYPCVCQPVEKRGLQLYFVSGQPGRD